MSEGGSNTQIWKQTSNPVTREAAGVEGYEAVTINYSVNDWFGLEYNTGGKSVLDGNEGDHWYYAIG